jgi:DNA-binding GntR family transcriptional regulator
MTLLSTTAPECLIPVSLDRASSVPLYTQIATQLRSAISAGQPAPGQPFEKETDLAARLRVSRVTVRRALQELVDEGLLVRRRGAGTTVAVDSRLHRELGLTSLHEDLVNDGKSPRTTVLSLKRAVDGRVARELDLPQDTSFLLVTRLRSVDDHPVAVMRNWIAPRFADLTSQELIDNSLYRALRIRGAMPALGHQVMGARMPTTAERRHLQLRGTAPVLTVRRAVFEPMDEAVELGDHAFRSDLAFWLTR